MHLLSTLQTPRCRGARKTRSWPVCSTLTRPDFHRQADTSFPNAPGTRLSEVIHRVLIGAALYQVTVPTNRYTPSRLKYA